MADTHLRVAQTHADTRSLFGLLRHHHGVHEAVGYLLNVDDAREALQVLRRAGLGDEPERTRDLAALTRQCAALREHLSHLHGSLPVVQRGAVVPSANESHESMQQRLLRARSENLRRELERVRSAVPQQPAAGLVGDHVRRLFAEHTEEVHAYVNLLKEDLLTTKARIERATLREEQLVALNRRIAELLDSELTARQQATTSADDADARALAKIEAVSALNEHLTQRLAQFVDEHFPHEKEDQDEELVWRLAGPALPSPLSLKAIIEALVNQSFDSPDDPYIRVDPSLHRADYVEYLLRAGVVTTHRDSAKLIRLVNFYD